jgi:hypothetical protein
MAGAGAGAEAVAKADAVGGGSGGVLVASGTPPLPLFVLIGHAASFTPY